MAFPGMVCVLFLFSHSVHVDAAASQLDPEWGDWSVPEQVGFWVLVLVGTPFALGSIAVVVLGEHF